MPAPLIPARHPAYLRCRRAALAGRLDVVRQVLQTATPQQYDEWCFRLAILALETEHAPLLDLVLEQPSRMRLHGHLPSGPYQGLSLMNVALRTKEPRHAPMMWAVKALLQAGFHPDYRLQETSLHAVPLHHAVSRDDKALAELFLAKGARTQAYQQPQTQASLSPALLHARSAGMVKLLFEYGADPMALNVSKEPPLQAIVHEALSIDELVDWVRGWSLAGMDVDTPLKGRGSPTALAFFLSEDSYANRAKALLRFTPEHLRRVDAYTVALVQNGASLETHASDGRTLLQWACETAGPGLMAWVREDRLQAILQAPLLVPSPSKKRM